MRKSDSVERCDPPAHTSRASLEVILSLKLMRLEFPIKLRGEDKELLAVQDWCSLCIYL